MKQVVLVVLTAFFAASIGTLDDSRFFLRSQLETRLDQLQNFIFTVENSLPNSPCLTSILDTLSDAFYIASSNLNSFDELDSATIENTCTFVDSTLNNLILSVQNCSDLITAVLVQKLQGYKSEIASCIQTMNTTPLKPCYVTLRTSIENARLTVETYLATVHGNLLDFNQMIQSFESLYRTIKSNYINCVGPLPTTTMATTIKLITTTTAPVASTTKVTTITNPTTNLPDTTSTVAETTTTQQFVNEENEITFNSTEQQTTETPIETTQAATNGPIETTEQQTTEDPIDTTQAVTDGPIETTEQQTTEAPIETTQAATDDPHETTEQQTSEVPIETTQAITDGPIETTEQQTSEIPIETTQAATEGPIETTEQQTSEIPIATTQAATDDPIETTEQLTTEIPIETTQAITDNPHETTEQQTSEIPIETTQAITDDPIKTTEQQTTEDPRNPLIARLEKMNEELLSFLEILNSGTSNMVGQCVIQSKTLIENVNGAINNVLSIDQTLSDLQMIIDILEPNYEQIKSDFDACMILVSTTTEAAETTTDQETTEIITEATEQQITETSTSTITSTLSPPVVLPSTSNSFNFVALNGAVRIEILVEASRNAYIAFSNIDNDFVPPIEIIIGASTNTKTQINQNMQKVAEVATPDILSGTEFRKFYVEFKDGLVSLFQGDEPTPLISYQAAPFDVNYIAVKSMFVPSSWSVQIL